MMDQLVGALLVVLGIVAVPAAVAELLHWRASRRLVRAGAAGAEAILVLGYSSRNPTRLHPLQRWRTQIAVRSMDAKRDTQLVFTGAARRGGPSEAEVMAAYARDVLGVPGERISLETEAISTWENVQRSLPQLESAGIIKVASDPMHAARAREYLSRLRPELASRLAAADDYRFGENWWLKLATAAFELQLLARRRLLRARHG
jgi:uncharacterized SAM-binding protein YcdF (DUF218 family)